MSELRNESLPVDSALRNTGARRHEGADEGALAGVDTSPHGYDPVEFGPGESRRDFPPRRERGLDEERRLLKEISAAFEGPDKRHDMDDGPGVNADGPETHPDTAHLSRLYRE